MSSSPLLPSDRSATVFKTPTSNGRCRHLDGSAASTVSAAATGGSLRSGGRSPNTLSTPLGTPRRLMIRTPRSMKTPGGGDRFIPSRSGADLQFSTYKVRSAKRRREEDEDDDDINNSRRRENEGRAVGRTPKRTGSDSARRRERLFALRGRNSESRVLNIKQHPPTSHNDSYWKDYSIPATPPSSRKPVRKYPKTADKILDAPNLIDDFYLNVLDWSNRGTLAIALGGVVYLLNTETSDSSILCSAGSENTYISSTQWDTTGHYLAIGTSNGDVQLWDVDAKKQVHKLQTHDSRINSLAWNHRSHLLSSASQSGSIHNYDVRQPQYHVGSLNGHSRDICGLRWSPNGRFLASGGDGNVVCIWDVHSRDPWSSPAHIFKEHTAAVKALSWCPWKPHLLASGGGSADQHICLWNACTGQLQDKIHTGSQISGLVWSSDHRELLSSHGHPHNELAVWSYPSLSHCASLRGHQARILHLTASPDGQSVASASADETLRFWKCFTNSDSTKTTTNKSTIMPAGVLKQTPLEMPGYIL